MFTALEMMNQKPEPFEFYTAADLWTDAHTSERMLACHLDDSLDLSSRNAPFIRKSVEWITSVFTSKRNIALADFGCGPGLYTTPLARQGAKVTGIDFSERSIAHARKTAANEGLDIRYMVANYLDCAIEDRFDLILMIMCDFCALSPSQRKAMLKKFNSLLRPGGSVLLDVYSLKAFEEREEAVEYGPDFLNGFWSPDKYYGFLHTFTYQKEKVVLDQYTIVEAHRTRTVYNWLQYFSPEGLEKEFMESGFCIEAFYSDVAGTPFHTDSREFAVIATKR
ncbi:class I SAM-dependent methyltransferase [Desulfobotulus sp. H1]|uniref:Class I SAM-dependent methyltransferase n=1 Tax=Desulfobotulus pelophilus TaxID=2823377 RepID=A0ABT3N7H0_9BACT|nr:class I SAM-dependent methyltransferase [Desulfobotulus pelophilus]MCW7753403.1 class I SAM-dependent methyltransferase [Desulfobotulus pelophilus]